MQPKRIYIVYPRACQFFIEQGADDTAVPECHHASPSAAWNSHQRDAAECRVALAAGNYAVVGADVVGEPNERGAYPVRLDWSDVHEACRL